MSNPRQSSCNGTTKMDGTQKNTTTLCVKSFSEELRRDDIIGYFSAFGDVENVRICAFVEFTQAESVTKALESDFHTIAGRRVEITVGDDDRHQVETTFMDLNDDCIHEILSMECLSALDLCSVAETCRRFKKIAVGPFKRKHGKCDLFPLTNCTERILRNFGAVISDLKICEDRSEDNGTSVFDSVATYCSNTLESLHLRECVIPDNLTAKLKQIFNNLRKLKIENCLFEGASKELFAVCGSLVEFELCNVDVEFMIQNTFPKLQKFKYGADGHDEYGYVADDEYADGSVDGINFDSFILRHKNLTSITIWKFMEMPSLLPLIADNCTKLEELAFSTQDDKAFHLSSLGHLRKLYIHCADLKVLNAIREWNNLQFLENLTLDWVNFDAKLIQTLSQLKRLQVLRLIYCGGIEDWNRIGVLNQLKELEIKFWGIEDLNVVLLIKRLSNLKALSVEMEDFKVDLETYLRIVDVVRARPDKSKLTFTLNGYYQPQPYCADMVKSLSLNAHIVEMIFTAEF